MLYTPARPPAAPARWTLHHAMRGPARRARALHPLDSRSRMTGCFMHTARPQYDRGSAGRYADHLYGRNAWGGATTTGLGDSCRHRPSPKRKPGLEEEFDGESHLLHLEAKIGSLAELAYEYVVLIDLCK